MVTRRAISQAHTINGTYRPSQMNSYFSYNEVQNIDILMYLCWDYGVQEHCFNNVDGNILNETRLSEMRCTHTDRPHSVEIYRECTEISPSCG